MLDLTFWFRRKMVHKKGSWKVIWAPEKVPEHTCKGSFYTKFGAVLYVGRLICGGKSGVIIKRFWKEKK